jgi:outer membrane protein TolC
MTKTIRFILASSILNVSVANAQTVADTTARQTTAERQRTAQQLLDGYLRLAIANSPAMVALKNRQRSARELVQPAGALPEPMLGVMYQSMGPPWQPMAPMSMVQGEFSQVIPGVGKRQARRNVAQAEADRQGAEVDATHASIIAEVRSLFAGIYSVDQERRAIESGNALIDVMLGALTGRFISGTVDQEALFKTQVERDRLKEQQLDNEANRTILVTRLNRLLLRAEDATVPRLDALPEASFDWASMSGSTFAQSPVLRVQRAAITVANRRRESAEKDNRTDFLVGLAGGVTTTGQPIVTLRFGVELPLWRASKQQPLIRSAQYDAEAAENDYRAAELKLRTEIAELKARLKRDTDQIALYEDTIIPNTARALEAARSAYTSGRTDFATVIEDYRRWLDAQVGLARRQAERLATWAELMAIINRAH